MERSFKLKQSSRIIEKTKTRSTELAWTWGVGARLNYLQPGLFCVWGHRPVGPLGEHISRQLFAFAQERNRDRPRFVGARRNLFL